MHLDDYTRLIKTYVDGAVDETIATNDPMFNGDLSGYLAIGKSAVNAIIPVMPLAPKKGFAKVLDFGCGYGRISRHLRQLFPQAEMFFSDVNADAVDFCSRTFSGTGFPSVPDFASLAFPARFDFIWVGSVFTHIDQRRQELLFGKLIDALSPGGVLVLTFHGRRCLEIRREKKLMYLPDETWNRMVKDLQNYGHGYESYGREELGDWGVSLNSIASMVALSDLAPGTRVMALCEAGWANHQDVIAFSKSAVARTLAMS